MLGWFLIIASLTLPRQTAGLARQSQRRGVLVLRSIQYRWLFFVGLLICRGSSGRPAAGSFRG